jgi:two-component system chemotaxis response regulator CheB
MADARILITDDSVVVRRLLSRIIEDEPGLEVAGVAQNGRIALSKIERLVPDLVLLDIEMPEMDGLEALAELRKTHPSLPVVMFSTLTKRGAASTLDALALGASDYLTKPDTTGGMTAAMELVRSQLVPKIRVLCGQPVAKPAPAPAPVSRVEPAAAPAPRRTHQAIHVVAIGVSTGGPNALMQMLPQLPAQLPGPVLVVQHMPPMFTRLLADRLDSKCALTVREAVPGAPVRPGEIWIAPGDFHMSVVREPGGCSLVLDQDPPENSCRPAADVLFRSVAEAYGGHSLAVVMTGMGQDGCRGAERIREAGGAVLAQDEASSVVWGMPGFVVRAGLADEVAPLGELASAVVRWTRGRTGTAVGDRLVTTAGRPS